MRLWIICSGEAKLDPPARCTLAEDNALRERALDGGRRTHGEVPVEVELCVHAVAEPASGRSAVAVPALRPVHEVPTGQVLQQSVGVLVEARTFHRVLDTGNPVAQPLAVVPPHHVVM